METRDVFSYITSEETNWKTARVPLTRTKDWNMFEHIERCTNVSNAWYHSGRNDGNRPYDDIVTPIINVAFRSEGFDVKDIVPFVDDADDYYKSILIKKFHPQWARKNELDTFIDDVVETSVIYDLVLVKNINNTRPEVVDLKTIAFCDQTDVMAGPICIKHQYTPAEMVEFKGKWQDDKIDMAISLAVSEIEVSIAGNQKVKTPGKYVEVYELRGNLPELWIDENGDKDKYSPQMQIVCYYNDKDGAKQGITLYKGKDKPLSENFKALKIDRIRSKGRACGRSVVESLFEPQVWNNYSAIKIKALLDSAINVFITDSDELGNQKLSELKVNTILKEEKGANTRLLASPLQNLTAFTNQQAKLTTDARIIGSASEGSLGINPASGTPFALQNLVVQQGQGIHEYRQGKIATFFADVLYRDWILQYLVDEMDGGKKFNEELSLDEVQTIAETIATNQTEKNKLDMMLNGELVTRGMADTMKTTLKDNILKGKTKMYQGGRGFFEVIKGELKDIPMRVYVNIAGKQKNLAKNADALSNLVLTMTKLGVPFSALAKPFNEILEDSGLSPVDFTQILTPPAPTATPTQQTPPAPPQPQPGPSQNQPMPQMAMGQ
jgi:hypothetical protein